MAVDLPVTEIAQQGEQKEGEGEGILAKNNNEGSGERSAQEKGSAGNEGKEKSGKKFKRKARPERVDSQDNLLVKLGKREGDEMESDDVNIIKKGKSGGGLAHIVEQSVTVEEADKGRNNTPISISAGLSEQPRREQ